MDQGIKDYFQSLCVGYREIWSNDFECVLWASFKRDSTKMKAFQKIKDDPNFEWVQKGMYTVSARPKKIYKW